MKEEDDSFCGDAELDDNEVNTDFNGRAETTMTIGMQPRDNYRVVVAVHQSKLNGLTVDDDGDPAYVPSGQTQIPGFPGKLTPMLTVWRRYWYEFDSITSPTTTGTYLETNKDTATVTTITHVGGASELTLDDDLYGGMETYGQGVAIQPDGNTWHRIYSARDGVVTVQGLVSLGLAGQEFTFGDDDWNAANDLHYSLPYSITVGSIVTDEFARMYIVPVVITNPAYIDNNISFNAFSGNPTNDYQDLDEDDDFWYENFVIGWQHSDDLDNDYDPESSEVNEVLLGATNDPSFGADYGMLYIEAIREYEPGPGKILENYTLLQETGHALGVTAHTH